MFLVHVLRVGICWSSASKPPMFDRLLELMVLLSNVFPAPWNTTIPENWLFETVFLMMTFRRGGRSPGTTSGAMLLTAIPSEALFVALFEMNEFCSVGVKGQPVGPKKVPRNWST